MISVILTVLKILGLVLAGILGLVVLILCLVLFVPIRYKAHVEKSNEEENNINATAYITYLLHLVNIKVMYPGDELLRVRVSLFKIFPKKEKDSGKKDIEKNKDKKQKDKKIKEKKNKRDNTEVIIASEAEENSEAEETSEVTLSTEAEQNFEETQNEEVTLEDEDDPKLAKFLEKIFDVVRNIKCKVTSVCDKIKDIYENVDYYINVIDSLRFDRAFDKAKTGLKKILWSIRPRKIKGYLNFGSESPDTVGMVYGLYTSLHPFLLKDFYLYPHFEENIVEGKADIKGKITLFTIVWVAARIYFNKDVKYIIKKFQRK